MIHPTEPSDLPFAIAPPLPDIRQYRETDAEAIARLWRDSAIAWPSGGPGGGQRATAEGVRREMAEVAALAIFVAEPPTPTPPDAPPIVGFCSLIVHPREPSTAYIPVLGVQPAWHGRGIGRDLLKAALARTVALGLSRLTLHTWEGNQLAVPLYKRTGFFWVPGTSVDMQNYLPTIFRLPLARAFFAEADWYRDFRRELAVWHDRESFRGAEVFTYAWEHAARHLRVAIDRHGHGVVAIETDDLAISAAPERRQVAVGEKLPIGWRIESTSAVDVALGASGGAGLAVPMLATARVAGAREWTLDADARGVGRATIETTATIDGQPLQLAATVEVVAPLAARLDPLPRLRPGVSARTDLVVESHLDRVVVGQLEISALDGLVATPASRAVVLPRRGAWSTDLTLAAPTAGRHRLLVRLAAAPDSANRLDPAVAPATPTRLDVAPAPAAPATPAVAAPATLTAVDPAAAPAIPTAVDSAAAPATPPAPDPAAAPATPTTVDSAAAPATLTAPDSAAAPGAAAAPGTLTTEFNSWPAAAGAGLTVVGGPDGGDAGVRPGTLLDATIVCARPGEVDVEQVDDTVVVTTDQLRVELATRPNRWMTIVSLVELATGRDLIVHQSAFGPPFIPCQHAIARWRPEIARENGRVRIDLCATVDAFPDLLLKRTVEVAASGVVRLTWGATNLGAEPRTLSVIAMSQGDGDPRPSQVAAPLVTGLVVDDRPRFPDWSQPDVTGPERFDESWIARVVDGRALATLWERATEVWTSWELPGLQLDLGEIAPGATAESGAIYLSTGPGDWRTVRALWRDLIAPDAPAEDPIARRAVRAQLACSVVVGLEAENAVTIQSDLAARLSGEVTIAGPAGVLARGAVEGLRTGSPRSVLFTPMSPEPTGTLPLTIRFDHAGGTERFEATLVRLGPASGQVAHRAELALPARGRRSPQNAEKTGEGSAPHHHVLLENGRLRLRVAPATLGRAIELALRRDDGSWIDLLDVHYPGLGVRPHANPWLGGIHPVLTVAGAPGFPIAMLEADFAWRAETRRGAQGIEWRGIAARGTSAEDDPADLALEIAYLTVPGSNVLALVARAENLGARPRELTLGIETRLRPRHSAEHPAAEASVAAAGPELYLDQLAATHRPTPGEIRRPAGRWCAVGSDEGPTVALIAGSPGAGVVGTIEGLAGAGAGARRRARVRPGGTLDLIAYLVVADDLAEARRYRALTELDELP